MRSICFFCSYYVSSDMPYYVEFYLKELRKHFTELVLLTNEKEITKKDKEFLKEHDISYKLYKNEGLDFGMWQKAFFDYDVMTYDRVGLINDSSMAFRSLDGFFNWLNRESPDYGGIVDCDLHSYHVQSYFIIINKKAIPFAKKYLEEHALASTHKEVIEVYEIGLSKFMLQSGMKLDAYFSFRNKDTVGNPSWMQAINMIKKGFPLIKRRIVARNYGGTDYRYLVAAGFDAHPSHYIRLIKKVTGNADEIDRIFADVLTNFTLLKELEFQFMCFAANMYGTLRRGYRKAKYGKP